MRRLLLIFLVIASGCATNVETVLRNDSGNIRYCYLSHDSTLARVTATAEYNKCLNEAGAAGYKKVQWHALPWSNDSWSRLTACNIYYLCHRRSVSCILSLSTQSLKLTKEACLNMRQSRPLRRKWITLFARLTWVTCLKKINCSGRTIYTKNIFVSDFFGAVYLSIIPIYILTKPSRSRPRYAVKVSFRKWWSICLQLLLWRRMGCT